MRRREILTGLALAPCVGLLPSIARGSEGLSIPEKQRRIAKLLKSPEGRRRLTASMTHPRRCGGLGYSTVPQGRPFRPGYEFVRGDLALFTAGGPVESVTYTLVGPLSSKWKYGYAIGPVDRVPVNPAPGEYYPALHVPLSALPGEYQIRWKVRLENGEVRDPVQPFWVG